MSEPESTNKTAETRKKPVKDDSKRVKKRSSSLPPKSPVKHDSHSTRGKPKAVRKRRTKKAEDSPTAGRRYLQTSITDLFPVRRSSRKTKSQLEKEQFEELGEKLRSKNEDGLSVVDVEGKGRGVVSTCAFRRGQLVCEYSGELISYSKAKQREEEYLKDPSIGCYMYYFTHKTKKLCVDATKDNGRKGRLLNHSKTGSNVVTKLLEVDGSPYLCLLAARDITEGEELVYDYGERSSEAVQSHPWLAK